MQKDTIEKILKELIYIDKKLEEIQIKNRNLQPTSYNLLQYVITSFLHSENIHELLAQEGFSSLGRSQGHIRFTILKILEKITDYRYNVSPPIDYKTYKNLKLKHAKEIFGRENSYPYIMITLSTDAAENLSIIDQLVDEGVTIFRINTAHDRFEIWKKMAEYIIFLREQKGKDLKIYMDLAGPKIRVGKIKDKKIPIKLNDRVKVFKKDIVGERVEKKDYEVAISCTNKDIFKLIKENDSIYIDDGKIFGIIERVDKDGFIFEIESLAKKGKNIKEEKGINLPDSDIILPALTDEDKKNLKKIINFADMIGLSFTQDENDIEDLIKELNRYEKDVGIVPKIETKRGVKNIIRILLKLIESKKKSALMIARGDLAIEIGFENLPFIQQEIIDLCNSAIIPIIYATQVLESKMKTNLPSRAETIDAAYANRADCIMLNKGPFAKEAIKSLKHILSKYKKLYDRNRHILYIEKEQIDLIKDYLKDIKL